MHDSTAILSAAMEDLKRTVISTVREASAKVDAGDKAIAAVTLMVA